MNSHRWNDLPEANRDRRRRPGGCAPGTAHVTRSKGFGQTGLTLVELMIAMVLGLLLILAASQVFLSSKRTYTTQEAVSRIQENGRFGIDILSRNIRKAGYTPCGNTTTSVNVINTASTNDFLNFFGSAIRGYDDVSSTSDLPSPLGGTLKTPVTNSDAVLIISGEDDGGYYVTQHNPTSAQFKINQVHDFNPGDILMACDLKHTAMFQITNSNQSNRTMVHNTGTGTPGNCTKGLGAPLDCSTNGTAYTFGADSHLIRMHSRLFFIANNDDGVPALYQNDARNGTREMVPGVEDMQIQYGEDTDGDDTADVYRDADNVANWDDVRAARLRLLVQSLNDRVTDRPQTYTYDGSTVTASDNRLRRVFTTTIALRNRLP